jgi:hypothetical protein
MEIKILFFDDVAARPAEVRREVLEFLGADPGKASGDLPPEQNNKSRSKKMELTDRLKRLLVEHFRDELRACAETFGGHAAAWAANYGV